MGKRRYWTYAIAGAVLFAALSLLLGSPYTFPLIGAGLGLLTEQITYWIRRPR